MVVSWFLFAICIMALGYSDIVVLEVNRTEVKVINFSSHAHAVKQLTQYQLLSNERITYQDVFVTEVGKLSHL